MTNENALNMPSYYFLNKTKTSLETTIYLSKISLALLASATFITDLYLLYKSHQEINKATGSSISFWDPEIFDANIKKATVEQKYAVATLKMISSLRLCFLMTMSNKISPVSRIMWGIGTLIASFLALPIWLLGIALPNIIGNTLVALCIGMTASLSAAYAMTAFVPYLILKSAEVMVTQLIDSVSFFAKEGPRIVKTSVSSVINFLSQTVLPVIKNFLQNLVQFFSFEPKSHVAPIPPEKKQHWTPPVTQQGICPTVDKLPTAACTA